MNQNNYDEYRDKKMRDGEKFQDFVQDVLYDNGIVISSYTSKAYQFKRGENRAGIEIKFDDRLVETGNLYIEVAEKARPREGDYAPSGIYRKDNTWLYVIGNYFKIFIFGKNSLKILHSENYFKEVEIPTSKGFLLRENEAEYYAEKVITLTEKKESIIDSL